MTLELLSLQQSCYLCLVGHLHLYPTELLSLLPTSLRRLLFAHLPAIDLHRMEQTSVAEGIDTSSYWEALYHSFIIRPSLESREQESTVDYKAIFLRNVVNYDLYNTDEVLFYLLSLPLIIRSYMEYNNIESMLVASGLEVSSYRHAIIPCRFQPLYTNYTWRSFVDNVLTTIKVLVNNFEICAHTNLFWYQGSEFSLLKELEKRDAGHDLIVEFFKNTESITLDYGRDCSDESPSHLFKTVLSSENPKLSKVDIDCIFHTDVSQPMKYIAQFLSPSIRSHADLKCTPYDRLQELYIAELGDSLRIQRSLPQNIPKSASSLYQLARIIKHQKQLRCVKFAGSLLYASPGFDDLFTSLIYFVSLPSFEELHISGFLKTDGTLMMLIRFLTVPTTHVQSVLLSDVYFVGQCSKHVLHNLIALPDVNQENKILKVNHVDVKTKKEMINVISSVGPKIVLQCSQFEYSQLNFVD